MSISDYVKNKEITDQKWPSLLQVHLCNNTQTQDLEKQGGRLKKNGCKNWDLLSSFIKGVCKWGGYSGIGGRILKNNDKNTLKAKFQEVISNLRSISNIEAAIKKMHDINGLGDISFASKHLRFIFPEYCPVLDKKLSESLGYKLIDTDYVHFSNDCAQMAEQLKQLKIYNPFPGRNSDWYPCDVEAAIYAHVKEWQPCPRMPQC